jgi:hypothetical protein
MLRSGSKAADVENMQAQSLQSSAKTENLIPADQTEFQSRLEGSEERKIASTTP